MMYIWKEWKEQSRGKGLWLSISMVVLLSIFILIETRQLPLETGFQVLLLSLHEINVYLIPLLSLFLSSFAVIQEKELKTMLMLTTKKESYAGFLFKKSVSIQVITLLVFISFYFLLAIIMKFTFLFQVQHFLSFLIAVAAFLLIFNQIGVLIGSICRTKIQAVGANIFTWFLFVFLIDLLFLFYLPNITYDRATSFSILYFLDPLHTLKMYLESSLGVFSLEHMSRLMEKVVWMSPMKFLILDVLLWTGLAYGLAIVLHGKERNV